jgi:starch synthase
VVGEFATPWGEAMQVLLGSVEAVPYGRATLKAYVLRAPGLYDRPGNPYENAQRQPYPDNHRRFAALGWAAERLAAGLDANWQPERVHAHDWHAALACACLHFSREPRARAVPSLYTVHNLAYQGVFDAHVLADLGLPASAMQVDGLEFYGNVSFMKAGLYYANAVTTVSPGYAQEIQTPEQGCGLDGLLRARRGQLHGILNAVDGAVWNPATDVHLPSNYTHSHLAGKASCKASLQAEMGLTAQPDAPLFAMVSRLTEQKGFPLVLAGVQALVEGGGQLVVLGSGDADLEQALQQQAGRFAGRVAVRLGYDEALAHRIFGASDVTLVPSRFEPCGLTQMYGLLYGSVPLVRAVGGLADTVVDADIATLHDGNATGFVFQAFSVDAYLHAVRRALTLYRHQPAQWAQLRLAGMTQDLSWGQAARAYLDLYRRVGPH